jgi:hypothetical protein
MKKSGPLEAEALGQIGGLARITSAQARERFCDVPDI